jgi:hypothetical protein
MKLKCSAVLALVAGLGLCPVAMRGDSDQISRYPLSTGDVSTPEGCPLPPDFEVTGGEVMTITHVTQSASGVLSIVSHEVFQGASAEATDPVTGLPIEYRLVSVFNGHILMQDDGSGVSIGQQELTVKFVGKGQTPDITGHTVLHMTVHPDGSVTGNVENIMIDCPQ